MSRASRYSAPSPSFDGRLTRGLGSLAAAVMIGLGCLARAEVFTGDLDVASHPTVVIPLTLMNDGSLNLEITVGSHLNLNANAAVGVTEGVILYDSTGTNRLYGAVQAQGTTQTHTVDLAMGQYFLRLTKLGQDAYWGTYAVTFNSVGAPIVNSPAAARGFTGQPFTYTITALGGGEFGAPGLPPELSLDPATGLISGTPGQPGTYNVTLLATNASGNSSASLTLTILPLPTLSIQAAAGHQFVLSWPADYADFVLLNAGAVDGSAAWEPVQPEPTPVGGSLVVTNGIGTGPGFYRLNLGTRL